MNACQGRLGGKIVKYATGYHLLDLFVGSEGTLGVVTEITLRLLALPPHRTNLLVPFRGLREASEAVTEILRRRRLPSVLEFMDHEGWKDMERQLLLPNSGDVLRTSVSEHRTIIEAISDGDVAVAADAMHNHFIRHDKGEE